MNIAIILPNGSLENHQSKEVLIIIIQYTVFLMLIKQSSYSKQHINKNIFD